MPLAGSRPERSSVGYSGPTAGIIFLQAEVKKTHQNRDTLFFLQHRAITFSVYMTLNHDFAIPFSVSTAFSRIQERLQDCVKRNAPGAGGFLLFPRHASFEAQDACLNFQGGH